MNEAESAAMASASDRTADAAATGNAPMGKPPGQDDDPAQRWSALARLATAMMLAMSTWFSASAVLGQLRETWGLSTGQSSWLTIAVQMGFVVGAVASALTNLADRVAPRVLMLVGALGAGTANLGLLVVDETMADQGAGVAAAGAIVCRFLTGASLALVYPPGMKAMSTWFRRGRGLALGVMVGALTLGSALPHLVNSFGGIAWRNVIVATTLLTWLGGLIARFGFSAGPFSFPPAVVDPRQVTMLLRDRGVRLASIGYFGHMWELYAMWAWIAVFLADQSGSVGRNASLWAFVVIGSGAIGCWLGGVLGDQWGRTKVTSLAMIISGGCAFVLGAGLVIFGDLSPWFVVVISIIWGVTVVADSAQFSTVVTEVADQAYVGTAVTLQLAIGFTLTVATIWLVPVIRDAAGWGWAFLVLVPGPLVGIAAMLRLRALPEASQIAGGRG